MALHNRQYFHAFSALREPHGLSAALRCGKHGIEEALAFIMRPFFTQRIRQLDEGLTQHLALAPLLELAMDRFVVGIALGQHVPLCVGVQNPEYRFQDVASGHPFADRATVRKVFHGEMLSTPVPLVITQAKHDRTYRAVDSPR